MTSPDKAWTLERLAWSDPPIETIDLPGGPLALRASFGSGLTRRPGDPPGRVWAVGDRGPNLKVKLAVERYGLTGLKSLGERSGAKIMPRPDVGPAMAELQVGEGAVTLVRTVPLTGGDGRPLSGLPTPGGGHAVVEPAFGLDGRPLAPDPCGADTEGVAAFADGGFLVGDEYGPSLLRVDPEGRVVARWLPVGCTDAFEDATFAVEPRLPAIAASRQLNRGFEAVALSPDGRRLALAFQSPLAHPDEEAHKAARHVRIWLLEAHSGMVEAQYLFPLDPPESFRRDCAKGDVARFDLKVSELIFCGPECLIVLERGSETTKLSRVRLDSALALPPEHLAIETRPTLEELSGSGTALPALVKEPLFTSDDAPELAPDLEGMVLLSPTELLLVSDNDFGIEGVETTFWRLSFAEPIADG